MKLNLIHFVCLCLILAIVHSADPDPEVKKNTDGGLDSKTSTTVKPEISLSEKPIKPESILKPQKINPLEKNKDQVGNSKKVKSVDADKTTKDPSKPLGDKEGDHVERNPKDSKIVNNGEKEKELDKGSGSIDVPKEGSSMRKESFRGEQCDSSFKCSVGDNENHGIVACLRVPGDESPELSLLIQNKGKDPMDVEISAPSFVRIEKTKIQIQGNDDQKVKVSVGDGKIDKFITLKTSHGDCSLDFRDFLMHNPMKKSDYMSKSTYINLFRQTPFVGFIILASLLVIASVIMCVSYQRRRIGNIGTKYQKLDAELPVSGGPKVDFDQKDGWNDNWSDGWDDVEAPNTPSMPLTPSISSSGVSSRRVNKDGWKD